MRSILVRVLVGALVLFGLAACGQPETLYDWNGYNRELLAYYKTPAELNIFADKLYEDIEEAEVKGTVPPGLYAEYGYAVMQLGQTDVAIAYFTKERDAWPEAIFLMDNVINRLGGAASAETPETDEESAEGGGQ